MHPFHLLPLRTRGIFLREVLDRPLSYLLRATWLGLSPLTIEGVVKVHVVEVEVVEGVA